MKYLTIIDDNNAYGGFTSGDNGVWSREKASDPPTDDYKALGSRLGVPLTRIIRPYQAGGDKAEIAGAEHGGAGVIKDDPFKKTDGLVTAEKGLVLSIIAADCVPVYLIDKKAGVVGLLHCGWRSAAGMLIHNGVQRMIELGASSADIQMTIGPHICCGCYEVSEEAAKEYAGAFTAAELNEIFDLSSGSRRLDLAKAVTFKAAAEGILPGNISDAGECTCHDMSYYSYRRGDRGRQNLAFIMMKQTAR